MHTFIPHFLCLLFLATPVFANDGKQFKPRCFQYCDTVKFWKNHDFHLQTDVSDNFYSYSARRPNDAKWITHDPEKGIGPWDGRQPGYCQAANVWNEAWRPNSVGGLRIQAQAIYKNNWRYKYIFQIRPKHQKKTPEQRGYHTYTTGMVSSRKAVMYGYFEVEATTMRTQLVNAFWLSSRVNNKWREIDVFENSYVSSKESKWNSDMRVRSIPNAHAIDFKSPGYKPVHLITARPRWYEHWEPIAYKRRTYGLLWTPQSITWFFNGKPFVSIKNQYWHQPMFVRFDVETNFKWHGIMPNVYQLHKNPALFTVHYYRVYSINWFRSNSWSHANPKYGAISIRDVLLDQKIGRIINENLTGKPKSATKLDEIHAMKEINRVRTVETDVFEEGTLNVVTPIDTSALFRAPYEGETFGKPVSPPTGMTWDEVIEKYAKKFGVPIPKKNTSAWQNFLQRVKNFFSRMLGL